MILYFLSISCDFFFQFLRLGKVIDYQGFKKIFELDSLLKADFVVARLVQISILIFSVFCWSSDFVYQHFMDNLCDFCFNIHHTFMILYFLSIFCDFFFQFLRLGRLWKAIDYQGFKQIFELGSLLKQNRGGKVSSNFDFDFFSFFFC